MNPHVILFFFVTAEDPDLLRSFFQQPMGDEISKRSGSAGYQKNSFRNIHEV
jgi:hypothetical protein